MERCQNIPIVVIDDERPTCLTFEGALSNAGFKNVEFFEIGEEALASITDMPPGVILLDLHMPGKSGEDLLPEILSLSPRSLVIMVTAYDDLKTAIRCIKKGAYDYILKPLTSSQMVNCVKRAIQLSILRTENLRISERNYELEVENERIKERLLTRELKHEEVFKNFVTKDNRTLAMLQYCEAIAPGKQPILITGETGVGKELIARAIHELANNKGPFVAVNVAGLESHLITDSLFGHVKGAFTGASQVRKGLVEEAADGTLFLDEIGDLTPDSQIKLLRLLQENEYVPVGSDKTCKSQTRILTATHVDLDEKVERGEFRRDLYYRLITHNVQLPPLRERPDDIKPLLDYFLVEATTEFDKQTPTYAPELVNLLKTYHFPGNVRELRAMVFDAISSHQNHMLSTEKFRERISKERKRTEVTEQGLRLPPKLPTLNEITNLLISTAMDRSNNNQRIASEMLGISQQALSKRLKRKK